MVDIQSLSLSLKVIIGIITFFCFVVVSFAGVLVELSERGVLKLFGHYERASQVGCWLKPLFVL